jgi:hypothetical protein
LDSDKGFEKETVLCLKTSFQGLGKAGMGSRDQKNVILPGNLYIATKKIERILIIGQ